MDEFITKSFHLDIELDFENQKIIGLQTLRIENTKNFLKLITLDIQGLKINRIYDQQGNNLEYVIRDVNPKYGQALDITIRELYAKNTEYLVYIDYETTDEQQATSWLRDEQTSGGKHPYMFTQCQAIHCRSVAPFQDTPSIKSIYTMTVKSPKDIVVRASGNITSEDDSHDNYRVTKIKMEIPIPSYLVAIVAGHIEERKVGPRTYVISEPEDIQKAADELVDMEKTLIAMEDYLYPYEWGDYKIVVLPPAFPLGGMENPLLTFASPSIIVGDKSNVDVATHEMAHSWSGNLVTNLNWSNFWLNEGATVFTERKVTAKLESVEFVKVAAKLANASMVESMLEFGMEDNWSSLTPLFDINGDTPDDAFSTIPYEKGYQFLYYLETLVGEEVFHDFYVSYFHKNERHCVTVEQFQDEFARVVFERFSHAEASKIFEEIDWKTWLETPGIPPVIDDFETSIFNNATALADYYIANGKGPEWKGVYTSEYYMNLKAIFHQRLIENSGSVTKELAEIIDNDMNMHGEKNAEILHKWYIVAIKSKYHTSPFEIEDQFLGSIGRMKFLNPVYKALSETDKAKALDIFHGHESFYHPMAIDSVKNVLDIKNENPSLLHRYSTSIRY